MNDAALCRCIAHFYYKLDMSQQEIAERLSLSRSRVSRLLTKAKAQNIVEISINGPHKRNEELEKEFKLGFGVRDVTVVTCQGKSRLETLEAVAQTAADELTRIINNDTILGITWGRTLEKVVSSLCVPICLPDMLIVQMVGSLESNYPETESFDLIRRISELYRCKYKSIALPFVVDNKDIRDLLISRPAVNDTMCCMEQINMTLMGLGSVKELPGYLSDEDKAKLQAAGAVGIMAGYYIDIDGKCIDIPLYDRLVFTSRQAITGAQDRMFVLCGKGKQEALLGLLRGGYPTRLCIDDALAQATLELNRKKMFLVK